MSETEDKSRQPETAAEISREAMYDHSDLTARGVVYFLVALAVTVVIIHLITWGFLRHFAQDQLRPAVRNAAVVTPPRQAGLKGNPVLRFPAPRLQPDPVADLNKFRSAEEDQLDTYGWVDQANGVAHIPIERAIDMVAKYGLPVRPQPVLPPRADFGSGDGTPAGAGAGTEPKGNQ